MRRFLEISAEGIAFHAPNPATQFLTTDPPKEILFCDCMGVGMICHHVYAADPEHPDEAMREDRHLDISGPHVTEVSQDDWKARHVGRHCHHRRQFFIDVTDRPEAQLGMRYDEATDTFSTIPVPEKV